MWCGMGPKWKENEANHIYGSWCGSQGLDLTLLYFSMDYRGV